MLCAIGIYSFWSIRCSIGEGHKYPVCCAGYPCVVTLIW